MDELKWARAERLVRGCWLVHLYADNLINTSMHMSDALFEKDMREICIQALSGNGLCLTVNGVMHHGHAEEKFLFNANQWD